MKGPRFKSAMRSLLDYAGEGLKWMGLMWIVPPVAMTDPVALPRVASGRRCDAGCVRFLTGTTLRGERLCQLAYTTSWRGDPGRLARTCGLPVDAG